MNKEVTYDASAEAQVIKGEPRAETGGEPPA